MLSAGVDQQYGMRSPSILGLRRRGSGGPPSLSVRLLPHLQGPPAPVAVQLPQTDTVLWTLLAAWLICLTSRSLQVSLCIALEAHASAPLAVLALNASVTELSCSSLRLGASGPLTTATDIRHTATPGI